ncbi:MAG: PilZ domain-containing protein [Acidobacteriota bacterium]
MTKKAAPKKKTAKKLPKDLDVNRRREWRFDLPLKTVIEGKLPQGKKFQEETELRNISSGGAYFCLDSGVAVGSKLNLMIDLPDKLTDGKKMKLWIGGITVRLEKAGQKSRRQGVAIRFSDDFKVIPVAKKK